MVNSDVLVSLKSSLLLPVFWLQTLKEVNASGYFGTTKYDKIFINLYLKSRVPTLANVFNVCMWE